MQNSERSKPVKDVGDGKICPFMSSPMEFVLCTDRCKLYRSNKGAYSCYFMELQAISYNSRKN